MEDKLFISDTLDQVINAQAPWLPLGSPWTKTGVENRIGSIVYVKQSHKHHKLFTSFYNKVVFSVFFAENFAVSVFVGRRIVTVDTKQRIVQVARLRSCGEVHRLQMLECLRPMNVGLQKIGWETPLPTEDSYKETCSRFGTQFWLGLAIPFPAISQGFAYQTYRWFEAWSVGKLKQFLSFVTVCSNVHSHPFPIDHRAEPRKLVAICGNTFLGYVPPYNPPLFINPTPQNTNFGCIMSYGLLINSPYISFLGLADGLLTWDDMKYTWTSWNEMIHNDTHFLTPFGWPVPPK